MFCSHAHDSYENRQQYAWSPLIICRWYLHWPCWIWYAGLTLWLNKGVFADGPIAVLSLVFETGYPEISLILDEYVVSLEYQLKCLGVKNKCSVSHKGGICTRVIIEFTVQSVRVYLRDLAALAPWGNRRCEKFSMSCSVWESRQSLEIKFDDQAEEWWEGFPSKALSHSVSFISQLNAASEQSQSSNVSHKC